MHGHHGIIVLLVIVWISVATVEVSVLSVQSTAGMTSWWACLAARMCRQSALALALSESSICWRTKLWLAARMKVALSLARSEKQTQRSDPAVELVTCLLEVMLSVCSLITLRTDIVAVNHSRLLVKALCKADSTSAWGDSVRACITWHYICQSGCLLTAL